MSKPSQLDQAIAKLEGQMAVLTLAITTLREQQQAKPRVVKPPKAVA